jgi:hypothetical protein
MGAFASWAIYSGGNLPVFIAETILIVAGISLFFSLTMCLGDRLQITATDKSMTIKYSQLNERRKPVSFSYDEIESVENDGIGDTVIYAGGKYYRISKDVVGSEETTLYNLLSMKCPATVFKNPAGNEVFTIGRKTRVWYNKAFALFGLVFSAIPIIVGCIIYLMDTNRQSTFFTWETGRFPLLTLWAIVLFNVLIPRFWKNVHAICTGDALVVYGETGRVFSRRYQYDEIDKISQSFCMQLKLDLKDGTFFLVVPYLQNSSGETLFEFLSRKVPAK